MYLIICRVGTTGLKALKFIPTSIYLFKVSNGNTRIMYEICSRRSGILMVNFDQISQIVLVVHYWLEQMSAKIKNF